MTSGPVLVRNMHRGPTVMSDGNINIEWAGHGDRDGRDVQPVPESVLNSVNFYRALNRGLLEKITDASSVEEIERAERENWQAAQERNRNLSQANIDQAPDKDFLILSCIADSPKGGLCETALSVRARDRHEAPPLCDEHKHLTGQFIAEETGRLIAGKAEVNWVRARLGVRERQQN